MNSSPAISRVGVAAGQQAQDVAFAAGEPVQLRVRGRRGAGPVGERVEHEAGQARGEHRVAGPHAAHRVGQLPAGDRLRDVPAGARADHRDDVLGGVGDAQRQEHHVRLRRADPAQHLGAAAVGHVDVEQHDVRAQVRDPGDRLGDRARLADHRHVGDAAVQLGAHAGAEQGVVVDEEDPHRRCRLASVELAPVAPRRGRPGDRHPQVHLGALPGRACAAGPSRRAAPSCRARSPASPCRSSGTASGSNPAPRSRTNTFTSSGSTSRTR